MTFAIVHAPEGSPVGLLAHPRDITGRFEHDRETRRRLRELEEELARLRGDATR
ncbi:hypothetical protein [Tepidiforma sp.]|uniref:hypothetical protein n=1 Tax=Tepidiforma sp. TaxID=2682230 RepID=UPI002ADD9988|nr:hypothetical protein [Tepidiforma sp.]